MKQLLSPLNCHNKDESISSSLSKWNRDDTQKYFCSVAARETSEERFRARCRRGEDGLRHRLWKPHQCMKRFHLRQRPKTEEGSKAKSIFLIMLHSRLIWSVNITHNFNTWAEHKVCGRNEGEKIISRRSLRHELKLAGGKRAKCSSSERLKRKILLRENFIMNIIKIAHRLSVKAERLRRDCSHGCQKYISRS